MRVISGIYKRRRFDVPRTFKARPTTDFAKENLFNVLSNYIELKELGTLPELIFKNNLLKEDGLFVLEHGKQNNFEDHPHFVERRVYGSVNFSFFK